MLKLLVVISMLSGCIVATEPRRSGTVVRESRSCPPAHHWEGGACVHNGRGHHKGDRD